MRIAGFAWPVLLPPKGLEPATLAMLNAGNQLLTLKIRLTAKQLQIQPNRLLHAGVEVSQHSKPMSPYVSLSVFEFILLQAAHDQNFLSLEAGHIWTQIPIIPLWGRTSMAMSKGLHCPTGTSAGVGPHSDSSSWPHSRTPNSRSVASSAFPSTSVSSKWLRRLRLIK